MEDVNIIDDNNLNNGVLTITPQIHSFLSETAKWAKFLAIIGFIMVGIIVIIAIGLSVFMGTLASSLPEAGPMGALSGGFVGIIYIGLALIYFFPILFLWRFATKMKIALASNDQAFLSSSFENLKSCYKYLGIWMAIILSFYVLILLFAIFAGGAAFLMG